MDYKKFMIEWKSFKNEAFATKHTYVGQTVWKLQKFEVDVSKISWEKANYGKKKRTICFSVFHIQAMQKT